ncbi:MAG: ATP-grasp domain-containing protein [Candidatus Saccharibacteria bacterium]
MRLLEYQAKKIISNAGVKIPKGELLNEDYIFNGPVVLKAQVLTGSRGKNGGVVIVNNAQQLDAELKRMRELEIEGYKTESILVEELIKFNKEYYFSLIIDRDAEQIMLLARLNGGVDVENHNDAILSVPIESNSIDTATDKLQNFYRIDYSLKNELFDFISNIYKCFIAKDAYLIEINPLIISENKLVALDCKIEIDNNALFRHTDITSIKSDANFVTLNPNGNVAIVANGAGLAMATVDQVNQSGMTAINFLDIGGGTETANITRQFAKFTDFPNITSIIVNIFAGITHCDQVAEAIVKTYQDIKNLPPIFVRLHGTNYDQAKAILDKAGIKMYGSLNECIKAAQNV